MTVASASVPGGDDVNALVLDVGSCNFRAGFAGEDVPRIFEPATLSFAQDADVDMTSGKSSLACPVNFFSRSRDGLLKSALQIENKTSSIDLDTDVFEQIVSYSYLNSSKGFNLDLSDTPLIMTEPNKPSAKYRRACLETVFERFDFPAASVLKRAPASAFSAGKQSALVLDIGASLTSVTPVYDGFVLQKPSLEYFGMGGDLLDSVVDEVLRKKRVNVVPFFKRTEGLSAKFLEHSRLAVVRELKHEVCKMNASHLSSNSGYANWNIPSSSSAVYELPDGISVDVGGSTAQIIPEILFDPSPLGSIPRLGCPVGFQGIGHAVLQAVGQTDVDARKAVGSEVILVGGSSLFEGMPERLLKSINSSYPESASKGLISKAKVTAPSSAVDRQSASWLGCSIIASCATFQQLWISKRQFQEEGFDRLLHKQLFW